MKGLILLLTILLAGCSEEGLKDPVHNNIMAIESVQGSTYNDVKVLRTVDGDTIKVDLNGKEETVRLMLIDTPETHKPGTKIQPYGPEASDYAKERLTGKIVRLDVPKASRDKYGRLLAYVYIDGALFNSEIVKKGLARVAYVPSKSAAHLDEVLKAQTYAKDAQINIWSLPGYVKEDGFHPENIDRKSIVG